MHGSTVLNYGGSIPLVSVWMQMSLIEIQTRVISKMISSQKLLPIITTCLYL